MTGCLECKPPWIKPLTTQDEPVTQFKVQGLEPVVVGVFRAASPSCPFRGRPLAKMVPQGLYKLFLLQTY